jgi:exonuclease SbcC
MMAANRIALDLKRDADAHDLRLADDYADATPERLDAVRADIATSRPALTSAEAERDALRESVRLADIVVAVRARAKEKEQQHAALLEAITRDEQLASTGAAQLEDARRQLAAAEQDLASITYDRAKHAALSVAREQARRYDDLAATLEELERAASDTSGVDAAATAVDEASKQQEAAEAAVREADALLQDARRADMATSVREGLKPGDPCPVCGGIIGKLPKAAKSATQAAERALQQARAAEKKASDGVAAAAKEAVRQRERHERAVADASKRREELATAQASLTNALPADIAGNSAAIEAALAVIDAEAQRHDEASAQAAALRAQRDELQELMSGHAAKIADMRGTARALEEEAQAATGEAESNKKTLVAIAGEWQWERVLSQIEAKKDPRPTLNEQQRRKQGECDELHRRIATLEADEKRIETAIARAAAIRADAEAIRKRAQIYGELGTLLRANNFQDFVLSEAMEVLAESATEHLKTLHNRFAITVKKGEFLVVDEWQAGQERSAKTLSGGETFVASLALALALSDRLPELQNATQVTLDSLFLDEGFGTLDAETLETVISALEGLRSEERMVGMITHVRELAERIESRIEVRKAREGSTVHVTGAA